MFEVGDTVESRINTGMQYCVVAVYPNSVDLQDIQQNPGWGFYQNIPIDILFKVD